MFDSTALNVVIGLVFIYLLYSLFATVLAEILATKMALRARNLKEAVDRMLNDENEHVSWSTRLWDSIMMFKNPDNETVNKFYNHPEIKYLGSSGIFKEPSAFKAVSFSKTLIYLLNESGQKDVADKSIQISREHINAALNDSQSKVLGKLTRDYVKSLWAESYGDLAKFHLLLEGWFDRTMEQALEWYKRKIQIVLMVLGFGMAVFFNADTFQIIKKLSKDKEAREQMVKLASAYIEAHPSSVNNAPTSTASPKVESAPGTVDMPADSDLNSDSSPTEQMAPTDETQQSGTPLMPVGESLEARAARDESRLDSLRTVQEKLQRDIDEANTVLGLGGWLPDSIYAISAGAEKKYNFPIDPRYLTSDMVGKPVSTCRKWDYVWFLIRHNFWGFLITAIAISLGAPFWFDLLNKMMKLRTPVKQETNTAQANASNAISPLNREG